MTDRQPLSARIPVRHRVLVTGGAGFIGSHLTRRLLADGHEVTVLDDLSSSTGENLHEFERVPGFRFIEHDVIDAFDEVVGDIAFDRIYHLACPASPVHYQRDPIRTLRTCVDGSRNALDLAERTGARILFTSTSETYGDPLEHPQRETYWGNVNPVGSRSPYDEGKRCAEALFFAYHRHRRTPIKVARIFNTYGPSMSQDDGRVVPTFVAQAMAGAALTVQGTGQQTRSFCFVDDTVDGLIRLMESPLGVTGPINIGNPDEITVLELAQEVQAAVDGREPKVVFSPFPQDDPQRRKPDVALALEKLGWSPATTLKDGIALTVASARAMMTADAVRPLAEPDDGGARG